MSTIRLATAANVRGFRVLTQGLDTSDNKWVASIDRDALEDEIGRFRVWSGNLGALQKGHSSLDYRLRDSPLLSSNALKLLKELDENLVEASAVVSGQRLPYEEQAEEAKLENTEDEDDDDFFDKDEDDDDDDDSSVNARTELSMRFAEVVDIIDNLYKLSVRIRTPTIRSRSLKAAAYSPKDPETGIDILSTYSNYDVQHVKELLDNLRQPYLSENAGTDYDYLIIRLSAAITTRRRQFKYWKRHRDKLGAPIVLEETLPTLSHEPRPDPQRNDTLEVNLDTPKVVIAKEAPSQKTGRTMLSGTEATQHHQSLDEILDTKSVTSYAVTVKDVHGRGVDLPPPPRTADGEKDFECPYCYIICPARYGRGRAWRTHLLQDLQPYVCTYPDCDSAEQLFRSRREWAAHEATHRKAWRCPEHPDAIFKSESGLRQHLRREHLDSFPETQLPTLVKAGETSTIDTRPNCPICHASVGSDDLGDFHNHIANHLERVATFALPSGVEGADDGASSIASRGRSDSSASRNIDGSLPTNSATESLPDGDIVARKSTIPHLEMSANATSSTLATPEKILGRALLSVESLQDIPDGSQNRLDTLLTQRTHLNADRRDQDHSEAEWSPEEEDMTEEMQSNAVQREYFRKYLSLFPGCDKVMFYRRDGPWTGIAVFENEDMAVQALKDFDDQRFPLFRVQQNDQHKATINFMSIRRKREDIAETIELSKGEKDSATSLKAYPDEFKIPEGSKERVLELPDIPTLRSMHRTRKLLQRDQSVAPNDAYNQIISFCCHDLTRLKVDAIVNSSNRNMKTTSGDTLNNAIHKAAGPELAKEASAHGKLGPEPILTSAYQLPCRFVIHAKRPGYSNSNSTGHFNQLRDCYRNSLKLASQNSLRTLAFPCLGTGNVGFPPKVAARLALQEVREYLDATPDHCFERVIFCAHTAADEQAYLEFLPVYFPPTHDDVDSARGSVWSADRAALTKKILDARTQVQKTFADLNNSFVMTVPGFPEGILEEFAAIDSSLASIRRFLLWSDKANTSINDLKLFCSVMHAVCGNITEAIELAKDTSNTGDRTHKVIWDDSNADLEMRHGVDMSGFLYICRNFVNCLDGIITGDAANLPEMVAMRTKLEAFKARRRVGGVETLDNRLSAFDEVLYLREFQREAADAPVRGSIVTLSEIPSVAQLYKLDELQEKNTMAQPSAIYNHTVCLARENITKLGVDIIVNSTDVNFASMGTLDRSIMAKAGSGMQEEVKKFAGTSQIGDVKTTSGHQLPAKYVLHTIPPDHFDKNTKNILRNIYRDILHTAVSLRATSIAIPSIGTGMLNYPRKDSASLAMEEVKRFLETAEPSSLLEKIVFVVFSSNDEFIYKSILPVYFPPVDLNTNRALPALRPFPVRNGSSSDAPKRTLFDSIGDAVRSVRFGQPPEPPRPITANEEHSLIGFESHAATCDTCKDPKRLYLEGRDLCEAGYNLAQLVLWHMNMDAEQKVVTKPDGKGRTVELEFEEEQYPITKKLLEVVERSYREADRTRPFVSANRPYAAIIQDQATSTEGKDEISDRFKKARAHVFLESNHSGFQQVVPDECHVRVQDDSVEVYTGTDDPTDPLFVISMNVSTEVLRHKTTPSITVSYATIPGADVESHKIRFDCRTDAECNSLLRLLRRAVEQSATKGTTEATEAVESDTKEDSSSSTRGKLPMGDDYRQWNARLKEIRDQLSSNKKASGGLSDLRYKIDRLNQASSGLQSPRDKLESHQDALAILLLDYLQQDLKTRHGSYIGTKFDDIVHGLRMTPAEVEVAINELAAKNLIHNTIDNKTWVVSDPPEGLAVIPSGPTEAAGATSVPASFASGNVQHRPQASKRPLTDLAEWIVSYIPYEKYMGNDAGLHREISTKANVSLDAVERALQEISEKVQWSVGKAARSTLEPGVIIAGDPTEMYSPWICISKTLVDQRILKEKNVAFDETDETVLVHRVLQEGELLHWADESRQERGLLDSRVNSLLKNWIPHENAVTIEEEPKSPAQTADLKALMINELNAEVDLDAHIAYSTLYNQKWTSLDKQLVDHRVLDSLREPYEDNGQSLIVQRTVPRDTIEAWADRTRSMRRADLEAKMDRERRYKGKDDKGKGKKRGGRDDEQERLESVLAGDRKEDELRYFEGDGDDGSV